MKIKLILIAIISIVLSFFLTNSVGAVSGYDQAVRYTQNLSITSQNGEHNIDITQNYADLIMDFSLKNVYSNNCPAFENTLDLSINGNNPFIVSQLILNENDQNATGSHRVVKFWYSAQPGTELSFHNYESLQYLVASTSLFNNGTIRVNNKGNIVVNCASPQQDSVFGWVSTNIPDFAYTTSLLYFARNVENIFYPSDYDGLPISDVPLNPPSSYIPDFTVNSQAFNLTIEDRNFFTFDSVPFVCDAGGAPVINYNIRKEGENPFIDSRYSPTVPLNVKMNTQLGAGTYILQGQYYCGKTPEMQFSENAQITFYLDSEGNLLDAEEFVKGEKINNVFNVLDTIPTFALNEAIESPLVFLATLPAKVQPSQCQPITVPLPYLNEQITLPCFLPIYQQHFAPIVNLWSLLLTGFVSYGMAINLMARMKKDVNPKDDTIEAVKL